MCPGAPRRSQTRRMRPEVPGSTQGRPGTRRRCSEIGIARARLGGARDDGAHGICSGPGFHVNGGTGLRTRSRE
eukprot:563608-Alexandrium_andersonii.AAC.1